MIFKINNKKLIDILSPLIGAIDKKQSIPVLSHFLIEVKDSQIKAISSDMDIQVQSVARLETIKEEGKATVVADKLFSLIKTFEDDDELSITTEDEIFVITTKDNNTFKINSLNPAEYPLVTPDENLKNITTDRQLFLDVVNNVRSTMADNDARYYLNGMYIDIKNNNTIVVAADGHRLTKSYIINKMEDFSNSCIIPRKAVLELVRILSSDASENINILFSDNFLSIKTQNIDFVTKVINGTFPDYENVIPVLNNNSLILDLNKIKKALNKISILVDDEFPSVRFTVGKNKLILKTNNTDKQQANISMDFNYEGQEIDTGFNVKYLLDILGHIKTKNVIFNLKDGNSSCLIRNDGDNKTSFVIMPLVL
ncbi:MAG: DNA polymerase III subunit beta [Gammaproteobacteria bacterium]|nr:MAG: DNA polymerase III subunit beta [Gammaproteobacteria bacterium]